MAGIAVLVIAILVGVLAGAANLSVGSVITASIDQLPFIHLRSGLTVTEEAVLFQLRVPRVLMAASVGAALAVAGAAYQGVFRNPLADPYLLGAAAGAGLGATVVIAYGSGLGTGVIPIAAFVGALTGVGLAYTLGAATARGRGTATLLLSGIAVASFLTAIQTFVLQNRSDSLQQVYSFILGQLGASSWDQLANIWPYLGVSIGLLLLHGRLLDVLAVGDDEAESLGLRAARVRLIVLAAASLATATAVAVSGLIGFVGIVVPHIVRRLAGTSYRILIPLSVLGGGAFLTLADAVARTVMSPAELPIGVVTAFVGAPFFGVLLWLGRKTIA